jgi:hypothetical protein
MMKTLKVEDGVLFFASFIGAKDVAKGEKAKEVLRQSKDAGGQ